MSKNNVIPAHFEKKSQVIPNEIVFHREMSAEAKLLIFAINGIRSSAPGWVLCQTDLRKRLGFGKTVMKRAMEEAIAYGYLRVEQTRAKQPEDETPDSKKKIAGQFRMNQFKFRIDGKFTDIVEKKQKLEKPKIVKKTGSTSGCEPLTGFPATVNRPLPMPRITRKALEKAMPASTKKQKTATASEQVTPKSSARIHKRSAEHEERFQWLMALQLGDGRGYLSEADASYLSHAYSRQQLENAYCHLCHKIDKEGFKPKSMIAVFRHLLQNEHNARGKNADLNVAFAKKVIADLGWSSLAIHGKYVIDPASPSKDLSLNLEPPVFRQSLQQLYLSVAQL